jgi:NADH:ubiquinone oxidoreductase subunit C
MLLNTSYYNTLHTYFLQKVFIKYLITIFPKLIFKIKIIKTYEIELLIELKNLYALIYFFKNNTMTQFKLLVDLVIVDTPGKNKRFFVIYILESIYNYRLKLQSKFSDLVSIISITSLYSTSL